MLCSPEPASAPCPRPRACLSWTAPRPATERNHWQLAGTALDLSSGAVSALAPAYRPRRPTETVLFGIVREHLETFLAHARESVGFRRATGPRTMTRSRATRRDPRPQKSQRSRGGPKRIRDASLSAQNSCPASDAAGGHAFELPCASAGREPWRGVATRVAASCGSPPRSKSDLGRTVRTRRPRGRRARRGRHWARARRGPLAFGRALPQASRVIQVGVLPQVSAHRGAFFGGSRTYSQRGTFGSKSTTQLGAFWATTSAPMRRISV